MRSLSEIHFRIRQEASNLWGYWFPPQLPLKAVPDRTRLDHLPDAEEAATGLRGTALAGEIQVLANEILAHRIPVLGHTLDTGLTILWRRDFVHGRETGLEYFRRIPYLDAQQAGDHKIIWELNRHQHLITLAQAWRLDPRSELLSEIQAQIDSWLEQNPYHRGINWASALEVAFRALSWTWVYHLTGEALEPDFRRRLRTGLYQHGCHLARNLSYYFSPNTHLLGEAVALYALGQLFPELPGAALWRKAGARAVEDQMRVQIRDDGSHFEQSTYYHVYAVDMFLFYGILADPPEWFRERLRRAAYYLWALLGPDGSIPLLGDDDGGRFFHPYGARARFGRATLAACAAWLNAPGWPRLPADLHPIAAWWLGPRALEQAGVEWTTWQGAELWPDAGVAMVSAGDRQTIVDTRAFGWARAGHSHAHALSFVFRAGSRDILIDPGTYTYTGEPEWRDRFRETAAHSTVSIDGQDQAMGAGPFAWRAKPETRVVSWRTSDPRELRAECRYGGFRHCRTLTWLESGMLLVLDRIDGPTGARPLVEQRWRLGTLEDRKFLQLSEAAHLEESWVAPTFGRKERAPLLRVAKQDTVPILLAAVVDPSTRCRGVWLRESEVVIEATGEQIYIPLAADPFGR